MPEEKQATTETPEEGQVVYRRVHYDDDEARRQRPQSGRRGAGPGESRIDPALTPLLVGFAILLALVFLLGYLSVSKMEDVNRQFLDTERQHVIKVNLLQQLRIATSRLYDEARARHEIESRGGLKPPLALSLTTARDELNRQLLVLDRPPYAQVEKWRKLRADLTSFAKTTEDLEAYSREGFQKFRDVDIELNDLLLKDIPAEQQRILEDSENLRSEAAHRINLLTVGALIAGALVAAGTIWEVQRRFGQMREALELARRERQFSSQILEGMVSAVAAIDARDHIRSANTAFFEIFPQLSIGASVHDKSASPETVKILEAATASRVERATYRGRWTLNANGQEGDGRTYDLYSSPLDIDGGKGQIVTLVDVTEAAEAESVLRRTEALAAVGQATAQVAHEIRNPLGSIRLGVSMLRDMMTNQEALNTIELVERGINHLNKLVVDVTQFSRRKQLTRSETDLQDLVNASLELIADRLQKKQTPVEKHFSPQPLRGNWDADQLRQVFVNLLANAVDASEEKSPLSISTEHVVVNGAGGGQAGRPQQFARVTIADQGSGMDEATRKRVFEPFFTTKKRGTGLGLAITKQIVEQHGGRIAVASALGKGTRFTIDLPLNNKDEG